MSLKACKNVATNRYELDITIDGKSFQEAIQQAYKRQVKKMNVPGFRKGKAPLGIIEKYYGESVFFEDALNILYPEAVESAVKESGLEMVDDKVDFDLKSIDKNSGVEFTITITTKPEVTIRNYKGLTAEKEKVVVTDEEVEAEINRMADRNARMVTVEGRPAEKEDIAVIDFEGFVDGEAFEGGKAESYSLTLGSGQFIPGFEDQVIGHNTGDEFDVNVTFPEEYHEKSLAGKPAVFKVKLHEIKKRELPQIDDEFAKDVSEFDTLEDLKNNIREKLLEHKNKHAENDVENQLIDQLIENMEAEIPEAMFENRVKASLQDFDYRLQMQGMNLQTYMKYTGLSQEDMEKSFRPQAERQVKVRLALEKIAELENLKPTEEEIAAEYETLAKNYNLDVERVKVSIPESELVKDLAVGKAIDFVKSHADIKEVEKKTEKDTAEETKAEPEKAEKKTTRRTTKKAKGETEKEEKE
ncbi:MAG TPA: trigger factor [Clostridiales bacterium]|nr:trigger factor [Clostridiales bacterium]